MMRGVLVLLLVTALAAETLQASIKTDSAGLQVERRAVDDEHDHAHEEEEEDHSDEEQCSISRAQLVEAFNEVAAELKLSERDGHMCSLPVPECHHHDNGKDEKHHHDNEEEENHHDDEEEEENHHDDEEEEGHDNDHKESGSGEGSGSRSTNASGCVAMFEVCQELILHSGLASSSCLSQECLEEEDNSTSSASSGSNRPTAAQAYGFGFLMVVLVSLGSLLGIFIVPLVLTKDKNKTRTLVYKYVYFFMIALGTSALVSDAVLHLFPHAWGLHAHEEEEVVDDEHAHENDAGHGHSGVEDFVWKGTIALLAMYLFYLLEYILHGMTSHTHSHGFPTSTKDCMEDGKDCIQLEVGVPHGECVGTVENPGILHPATPSATPTKNTKNGTSKQPLVNGDSPTFEKDFEKESKKTTILGWLRTVKPLAWLIIIGDGIHNFADGLALGAAISQSLTLGIGTTIALILHELPHEFGDYVILLSTGLSWYSALLFNLFSSLSAILGFFVGVAAGTASEDANAWILAFAAGLFIYIALVDLLPELIHHKEKGAHRWGLFFAANVGFFISFLLLFLLAVYEEQLNDLL